MTQKTSNTGVAVTASVDLRQEAIRKVLSLADEWISHCRGKDRPFCEQYGCSSIERLVAPLRQFQVTQEGDIAPTQKEAP